MSLPRYIVNLPDLLEIIKEAMTDSDAITSKVQKSIGFMSKSQSQEVEEIVWTPEEDIGMIGLRFGQEETRNMGYHDNFDLIVDGEVVMSSVHHKELNEYKSFRNPFLVAENTDVVIVSRNESGIEKEVKYDIDYIEATIPQKEVIVICRDSENNNVIGRFTLFYKPVYEGVVSPPNVEQYEPITEPKQINIRVGTSSPTILEFYYNSIAPPEPEIPKIDHLYDWKLVLRWEGRVSTDLDFHAVYDGNEVYYGNREDVEEDYDGDVVKGVWLDHDFTNHSGGNDRSEKPEIMTVLGNVTGQIKFFVKNYRGGSELSESVTVDIYKFQEDGTEKLMKTITKDAYLFHPSKAEVDIATINLQTDNIIPH